MQITHLDQTVYKRDYYLYRNFTNILSAINRYRVSLSRYTWLFFFFLYRGKKRIFFHKNGHNIERIFTGRILRTLRVLSICNKKRNDVYNKTTSARKSEHSRETRATETAIKVHERGENPSYNACRNCVRALSLSHRLVDKSIPLNLISCARLAMIRSSPQTRT